MRAMAAEKRVASNGWLKKVAGLALKKQAAGGGTVKAAGEESQPANPPAVQPAPQPAPNPGTQPAPQQPAKTVYTVQRGDSLFLIGKRFGVSATAIKTANSLAGDDIYPGQKLVIPAPGTVPGTAPATNAGDTSPETAPGAPATGDSTVRHTVQQGDSLYLIAQKYWVSVEALKSANGLTGDEIYPGQVLVIPGATNRSGTPDVSRQATLSREDIDLMARVVYAEAQGEPYEGQVAVAAVILNRLKHPEFPKSIPGIVYEPYAFEPVANGQINQAPNDKAYQAVQDALNGWDPTGGALYFWNPAYSTSEWIKTRTVTKQIGNHVFGV